MAKIKVGIAGCLGRMGQELIKKILVDKNFIFVGGFEHKSHHGVGKKISDLTNIQSQAVVTNNANSICKIADVVIDFTTPHSTLSNVKNCQYYKNSFGYWNNRHYKSAKK